MFRLFKKKAQPSQLPLDGPWSIGEGEYEGKAMIVRYNAGYRAFHSVAGYDHQVGVATPLRNPEGSGLPSSEENLELQRVEGIVSGWLEEKGQCLFVAVITTNGMKELVFYASDPELVRVEFEKLHPQIMSHEIQLMIRPDKDWSVYDKLAPR